MGKKSIGEEEFIKAYDAYADAIFRHCYFRVFDRERAREMMQETFTRSWDYMVKGGTIAQLRSFLYMTANHLIIDHARKRKEASLETMQEHGFEPSHNEQELRETEIDAQNIIGVLNQLDEKYRDVILMRYHDGLKPKEIARILNETVNVVSVRINRGIKQLRALLK